MSKPAIEILSSNMRDAVHRIKINALEQQMKDQFHFCRIGEGGDDVQAIIINGLYADPTADPALLALLQKRMPHAIIMLFIADFSQEFLSRLQKWSQFVDVFLVPSVEMKHLVSAFTRKPVDVLFDAIDFGFDTSLEKNQKESDSLKVVWFGYPESYTKSMPGYEHVLMGMHKSKEIEYHLVTRNAEYGAMPNCTVHAYDHQTFPVLLSSFNICVVSHAPFDLHINTFLKSENKAVLAINRGLPVIASRTPAYQRLLGMCGLEEYLFSAAAELAHLIRTLKSPAERARYLQLSQPVVLEHYSSQKMVAEWMRIYEQARAAKWQKATSTNR